MSAEPTAVGYKKGNLMRYTIWGLGVICIGVLIATFVQMMNGEVSANVPEGYKFAVTNNYAEGSGIRTTYYVYDDRILVEDESFHDEGVDRALKVYDGIDTSSLTLNHDEAVEICELGSCSLYPKALAAIKKLLSGKVGREYIGF